jgi:amino acid transporter
MRKMKSRMRPWIAGNHQCKHPILHTLSPNHTAKTILTILTPTSNAILLNTLLASLYILLGNMRILLTLNGLGEYTFFFLTVLGAIILRFREPDLHRPIKPFILIPIVFAAISGFVVVRGAVFAPVQAGILVAIWVFGFGFYVVRKKMEEEVREAT